MNCRICNASDGKIIKAKDNETLAFFDYWECHLCGVVFLIDIPKDYSKYYTNSYYSLIDRQSNTIISRMNTLRDGYLYNNHGLIGKIISKVMPNANLKALQLLNVSKEKSLLDVGCGIGREILMLRRSGNTNVHGIDPYIAEDIFLGDEILVEKKNVDGIEGAFDFITLHHSFEHIDKPLDVLIKFKRHIKKNGKIMIRIPVADSYAYRQFGTSWVQFDAPRHIFLHTKKSMAILADQAGLTIESVYSDSSAFQFWGTRINKKGMSIHTASKKKVLAEQFISFLKNEKGFARKLNQSNSGDQAVFILADAV